MTDSLVPLKAILVDDPRVQINTEREYAILRGGGQVSWKPFSSTSYSNSSFSFSCPPPSPGIIVDRKVYLRVPVTLSFTCTNTGSDNMLQAGFDAFRAYPLTSCMSTLQVTLNNTSVSINMADVMPTLLRYHNPVLQHLYEYSMTPSMMDQYQDYSDGIGSNRNPLATYADSNSGADEGRGGFPMQIISNTAGSAQVSAVLTEPLFLSPFLFGFGDSSGFIGMQTMDFTMTWLSSLNRMWSHIDHDNISNFQVSSVSFGQPQLLFTYITPKELQSIPRALTLPYFTVDRYYTASGLSVVPNQSITINSNNIQLNSIPRRMYISMRRQNADLYGTGNSQSSPVIYPGCYYTDTFFSISNISVNWNNYSGLLSSATQQDLYNISKKNGVNLSWTQWSGGPTTESGISSNLIKGTVGSVLCLEFGTDIGLSDTEAPGLLGTYQLQMNVTGTNVDQIQTIVNPQLLIIVVSEGSFTVINQNAVTQIGVVTKQDVLDAHHIPGINYHTVRAVHGADFGDFLSGLKGFGEKVFQGLRQAAPVLKEVGKVANAVAPLIVPEYAPIAPVVGKLLGGKMRGGAALSRSQMRDMIMQQ